MSQIDRFEPVKWEDLPEVEVRDDENGEWNRRRLLAIVTPADSPYKTIERDGSTSWFKQMRRIPQKRVVEMTFDEVAKICQTEKVRTEFGVEIINAPAVKRAEGSIEIFGCISSRCQHAPLFTEDWKDFTKEVEE